MVFRNWFLTKSSVRQVAGRAHLELTLTASKIAPFHHGIQLLIAASNDSRCPVTEMKQLIQQDTLRPPFAPLFCIGKHEQRPLTNEHLVGKLQEVTLRSCLACGAWNGHSFRRGEPHGQRKWALPNNKSKPREDGDQMHTKHPSSIPERNGSISASASNGWQVPPKPPI